MQVMLGNHCAQSPASVWLASPRPVMGHYKVNLSLCSDQKVWWSLHWVLQQGWADGLWELQFCRYVEFFSEGGGAWQLLCTEPCQCVNVCPWANNGSLQGQMQPLQ